MNYEGLSREELIAQNKEQADRIMLLAFELEKIKRLIFGTRSERFVPNADPNQQSLFDLPAAEPAKEPEKEDINYQRNKLSKLKPARQALPAHLPRVEVILEPDGLTEGMVCIGEEVTETLEYRAAKLWVRRTIRRKYVVAPKETALGTEEIEAATTQDTPAVLIAPIPERPIDKCIAEASLLAYVIISKYIDHLPLYRLAKIFKREQMPIPDSTIGGWVSAIAKLLETLYQAHVSQVLDNHYIQADESTIPVLDPNTKGKTHRGYYWVYHAPLTKGVLFQYCPGRGAVYPFQLLKNYKGYLQTDGYTAYGVIDKAFDDILLFACWAHARRKFDEAKKNNEALATWALTQIQILYAIERNAKEQNLSHEQRKELRLTESKPILDKIKVWLDENRPDGTNSITPKSPIGQAISYTLNLWERLIRYIDYEDVEIDNNLVENLIRSLALGRKNYLFAGSHDAAQRAAIFYSLFATCELNGVNPYDWLVDVLNRINAHPHKQIAELLPAAWKQAQNPTS